VRVHTLQHGQGEHLRGDHTDGERDGVVGVHRGISSVGVFLRVRAVSAPGRVPRDAVRRRADAPHRRRHMVGGDVHRPIRRGQHRGIIRVEVRSFSSPAANRARPIRCFTDRRDV
jgi:hypothetical protein